MRLEGTAGPALTARVSADNAGRPIASRSDVHKPQGYRAVDLEELARQHLRCLPLVVAFPGSGSSGGAFRTSADGTDPSVQAGGRSLGWLPAWLPVASLTPCLQNPPGGEGCLVMRI